jgi:hypothetical protein
MLDCAWFTVGSRGELGVEKGALRRKFFEESLAVFLPLASAKWDDLFGLDPYFILSRSREDNKERECQHRWL